MVPLSKSFHNVVIILLQQKININMLCFQWMVIRGEVYIIILIIFFYIMFYWLAD